MRALTSPQGPKMYPHRIRLRTPWECGVVSADDMAQTLPEDRMVHMPGSFKTQGLEGFAGTVWFRRRFGYPGRIDASERVWLTFDDIAGQADIYLNGAKLADDQTGRAAFDVTALLELHNHLEVRLTAANDEGGLVGEVAMEIRASAYLDEVQAKRSGDGLEVSGKAVGTAPDPLDLYVLLDRKNVHNEMIVPLPAGRPFVIQVPAVQGEVARVELVWRAQRWYVVEIDVSK
jgi:hypothetical protein